MAKLVREVRESLFEAKKEGKLKPLPGTNSFGEKQAMALVKKYLPFLNISFDDLGNRETGGNTSYSSDEEYEIWDQLSVETGNEQVDEWGVSLLLVKPFDVDEPQIKFYMDSVAFIPGDLNDEYTQTLDPVSLDSFTKEDWEDIFNQLKEYVDYDEEEWAETKTKRAAWDKEMHDKNSKWIKENNYKIKEGVYKGQWEYNWDDKLGMWLNIQDRAIEMRKRGFDLDFNTGKWVPKGQAPIDFFNKEKNKWERKYLKDMTPEEKKKYKVYIKD